jgi:ubiquitin carboxyl-terminal hydrolase 7
MKKREREEQHLFLSARVITDETFSRHEGFDLANFDEKDWQPALPIFRVRKSELYSVFKIHVAEHFGLTDNLIRLWVLVYRQNKTVRPDTPIPENESNLSMPSPCRTSCYTQLSCSAVEIIRNTMAARQNDLRLYLDVISDPSKVFDAAC